MTRNSQKTVFRFLNVIICIFVIGMLMKLNAFANPSNIIGYSNSAQTVYTGPGQYYVTAGSIGQNERVFVRGTEYGWYHIVYDVGTNYKSGYVPINSLHGITGGTPQEDSFNGGFALSTANQTVFSTDNFSKKIDIGAIYNGEPVTEFYRYDAIASNGNVYTVAFIEYSTSSGPKRGYVYYPAFCGENNRTTAVARVIQSSSVSYGYKRSGYLSAGSVNAGECVAVMGINEDKNLACIEYNTNNKRKRGYISMSYLSIYNSGKKLSDLYGINQIPIYNDPKIDADVYASPTEESFKVGHIYNDTSYYWDDTVYINGKTYWYVTFDDSNGRKSGFVLR